MTDDAQDIVRQVAANPHDQQRWLLLYRKFRPAVYYSAYRACRGERELAADMTQEAFERFFKYADLGRFESDRQAIAYLCQIAKHRIVSHLTDLDAARSVETADEVADPASSRATQVLDARHDVQALARDLSPSEQQLLANLLEGAEIAQIAREMRLSYGTAAVRVHRLIRKISNKISKI